MDGGARTRACTALNTARVPKRRWRPRRAAKQGARSSVKGSSAGRRNNYPAADATQAVRASPHHDGHKKQGRLATSCWAAAGLGVGAKRPAVCFEWIYGLARA